MSTSDAYTDKLRLRVLEEEVKKLYGLIEASTTIISTLDLDKLLDHIMVIAKKVIGAEASSLMLVDAESGNLSYEVALGEKGEAIEGKIQLQKGKGIAGWVAEKGVPLLVPDVSKDDRFYMGVDQITGFHTRSILCVPMKVREKLIGVLEAINPVKGDAFTQSDLEIFSAFSSLASIAIENARMTQGMLEKKALEKELSIAREKAQTVVDSVLAEHGKEPDFINYQIGTMIEIPRAAITADQVAGSADFFSFGTNDLTQMCCGFSRDDSGKFLGEYVNMGIYERDPFASLDVPGVGRLVEIAVELGRKAKPELKLGVCGEHGGDPASIKFFNSVGLNYVSCSPYRVPVARLAAAQAILEAE